VQLQEGLGLLEQGLQLAGGFDVVGQARALLLQLPRAVRIAPDLGSAQTLLEDLEGPLLAPDIKETSAATRPLRRAR
jgi:hypothetical protein